ncbi:MAG TPA: type III pantothenate kinase [Rhodanobacteraceae bacterium]
MAEAWLFDLGNSRAKLARLHGGEPVDCIALDWDRPDFAEALRERLACWPRAEQAWVASVVSPARGEQVRAALAAMPAMRVEWLTTPRRAGGVTNSYAKPERLGIDRFLAMIAAHASAPGACVVVGCGTALTLDAVAVDGQHIDGLIALSPPAMLRALQGATAIADNNPDAFASEMLDDTAAALQAGCWASAGALVEWFVARNQMRGAATRVYLHGGWSQRLVEWLGKDGCQVEVLENAVLHGLAAWVKHSGVEQR